MSNSVVVVLFTKQWDRIAEITLFDHPLVGDFINVATGNGTIDLYRVEERHWRGSAVHKIVSMDMYLVVSKVEE